MVKKKPLSPSKSRALVAKNVAIEKKPSSGFPVVGIGASAGGLEALEKFFTHMPPDAGIAFVIIQHLDPKHKSIMDELLKRHTTMRVLQVADGLKLEPNSVYLNPPDKDVSIFNGHFQLTDPVEAHRIRLPINNLFRSLAEDQGENAICIILSGSGSDGTLGLKEIKGSGGMVMVQDPEQAQYDSMVRSAIETGLADYVLPAEKMPKELIGYIKQPYVRGYKIGIGAEHFDAIQKVLMLVRSGTGHDFSHYKQNTIYRRVERRMALHHIADIRNYVQYLKETPAEGDALFKDIIIEVTSFFRDPEAFEALGKKIIPAIVEQKKPDSAVRVWVPGCATGEEAFSLAMLFQEAMDRLNKHLNVQIFATDINKDTIEQARTAQFPEGISADMPADRLGRFFIKEGRAYRVKKTIRDMVVFAAQNLISDPPFSKLDLVSCRNVLIYMDSVLQRKVIPLFHYTLNHDGYLFLGSSETIGEFSGLFSPVDTKWKIFQRKGIGAGNMPDYLHAPLDDAHPAYLKTLDQPVLKELNMREIAERLILDEYAPPCVFIDERFNILYFHGLTERYLTHPPGEPTFNLITMAREDLRYQLSAILNKAVKQKKAVVRETLQMKQKEGYQTVDVIVRSIPQPTLKQTIKMVAFEEKTSSAKQLKKKKYTAGTPGMNLRISSLEKELQSTKEYLQATIEQMQTSNEELRSANEELQSTNEELQSTNEELATSKEELQSTNEELITVNAELQDKIEALMQANSDINNLLAGTDIGTIFLDNALRIKRFTPAVTNFFNLIQADLGRPISDITSKIPLVNISQEVRTVLKDLQKKEFELQLENGNWYSMRILPYRTMENTIDGVVITFMDITQRKKVEQLGEISRIYAESIVETVREPLVILDEHLKVVSANRSFYQTFKTTPEETENMIIFNLGSGQWNIPELRELLEEIVPDKKSFNDFKVTQSFPAIGQKTMLLNARIIDQAGQGKLILLAIEDITAREQTGPDG
ncbi:MAG: chemotaxis protein CheB [Thermodesulfovibrionales bacterium]|nr:chemotaxis protein CheB [Thermodesulfovibrionales bacterium]